MNKVLRFPLILACVASSFSLEAAWTYNETTWDKGGIGSGTISDGKWTLTAKRIAKDSQMLKVYAEAGEATGPSELSPLDFTEIEGDFKVVTIGKIFGILTACKEKISELIAPDCTTIEGGTGYGFGGCSKLTKVVLSPEFSSFDSNVFSGCVELAVFSPSELKVTAIPYMAFNNCYKLATDFTCDNLISVARNAFAGCESLKKINAPKLEEISVGSFSGCTSLIHVKSKSLKRLGAQAFSGCTALDFDLKDILGPSLEFLGNTDQNVKAISESFLGCSSLKGPLVWDFPNLNPNIVHTNCFKNCTSLSSVVFKTPVEEIQNGAFLSIAPGAQLFMHKEPPMLFANDAIGNTEGPFPKVYLPRETFDGWLDKIAENNCVIRKSEFNTWSGDIEGNSKTWAEIAALMKKDTEMCSVADDDTVTLIGDEKRSVQAFVVNSYMSNKKEYLRGFWVIKNPDSGFRVSIR